MQNKKWNQNQIEQCSAASGLTFDFQDQMLSAYQDDFGGLLVEKPQAVVKVKTENQLSIILAYANKHSLQVTARCLGLSQNGQSISTGSGILIDLSGLKKSIAVDKQNHKVSASCSSTWRDIATITLKEKLIPFVLPYNLDISVGGILSVGGLGAATFKNGLISAHVQSMRVMLATGKIIDCSHQENQELFHACISGLGHFAIILSACLSLRPAKSRVRTFYLSYENAATWLDDQSKLAKGGDVDYLEAFTSPCLQGMKNAEHQRIPFAIWLYCLHLSYEYDTSAPHYSTLKQRLQHHKLVHFEDMLLSDYIKRHDERFVHMKKTGQWSLIHPWYECYVPKSALVSHFNEILSKIDLQLGGVYHIFPVARHNTPKYFMLPDGEEVFTFNILTAGISAETYQNCQDSLNYLNNLFAHYNGKRYLSGWLGHPLDKGYWQSHYGEQLYQQRKLIKHQFDEKNVFTSKMTSNFFSN